MNHEYRNLTHKIAVIEKRIESFADYLKSALSYLVSDPQSSLTKCRIVLERILTSVYFHEMGKESVKGMVGSILFDKEFASKIPPRIRARMNFIREMANLGPHGGEVYIEDASRVLQDVVYIVEWYASHYDLYSQTKPETSQSTEILPQLKNVYPVYLRPDITSVKFGQNEDRCYLEITTTEILGGDLHNATIRRTDLGFVADDDESLFFKPELSLAENVKRFINEFDEISIINCTDLFMQEASTMIYDYWSKHGTYPDRK